MVIFSVSSHSAAATRIIETLVGATAGLAAGLVFAPLRVQPAREAAGELSSQMAALLSQMAHGLAEASDPQRAAEWLDRTRALRGEIERVDDALATAEESIRLNPRRLRFGNPAAGLRDGLGTLEHAATAMRVLARSVADSARLDSADSPVNDPQTRAQLAAVLAGLSAAVDTYGQLLAARPVPAAGAGPTAEPLTSRLGDHLDAAKRQQDQLARLLRTNPAERPEGWPLRGEILSHIDRLRSQLDLGRPPGPARARPPLKALRDRRRGSSDQEPQDTPPAAPEPERTGGSGPGRQPHK
jgi:gas vesicle protein